MAIIELRKIERTPLDEEAFLTVLRRHWRGKKSRLSIEFKRDGDWLGYYVWNAEKRFHSIRIAINKHRVEKKCISWDASARSVSYALQSMNKKEQRIKLLYTALHEIRHAQQRHRHGSRWKESDLLGRNAEFNYFFDEWELDARAYDDCRGRRDPI